MRRHWKAFELAMVVLIAAFIVAIFEGWYVMTYGLIVSAIVYGFVYTIYVARLGGEPSYEDQDHPNKKAS